MLLKQWLLFRMIFGASMDVNAKGSFSSEKIAPKASIAPQTFQIPSTMTAASTLVEKMKFWSPILQRNLGSVPRIQSLTSFVLDQLIWNVLQKMWESR